MLSTLISRGPVSRGVVARSQRVAAGLKSSPLSSGRLSRRSFVTKTSETDSPSVDTEALQKKLTETLASTTETLKAKWEKTEDKPAVVVIGIASLIGLISAGAIVDAVDRIPIFSDLIELVGIGVTAWFIYRYGLYTADREELISNIKSFFSKIGA